MSRCARRCLPSSKVTLGPHGKVSVKVSGRVGQPTSKRRSCTKANASQYLNNARDFDEGLRERRPKSCGGVVRRGWKGRDEGEDGGRRRQTEDREGRPPSIPTPSFFSCPVSAFCLSPPRPSHSGTTARELRFGATTNRDYENVV